MDRYKSLDEDIEEKEVDAVLLEEDSDSVSILYLTEYKPPEASALLKTGDKSVLVVSVLDYEAAKSEAEVDEVRKRREFFREDEDNSWNKQRKRLLEDYGVSSLGVSPKFLVKKYQELEKQVEEIEILKTDQIRKSREIKSEKEIENLKRAQKATGKAMKRAEEILEESEIEKDKLKYEGKELTSERLKREIRVELARNDAGVEGNHLVVASGPNTANPHSQGEGPIKPHQPVLIDIAPKHLSYYHGDMSRTFVKGEVDPEIREMYDAAKQAFEAAEEYLQTTESRRADELAEEVQEVLSEKGYEVPEKNKSLKRGLIHAVGHGIGLEIHESPKIGSDNELKPGMVLAIEPGLYEPGKGGVRVEDMILITENGYKNLNSMKKELKLDS